MFYTKNRNTPNINDYRIRTPCLLWKQSHRHTGIVIIWRHSGKICHGFPVYRHYGVINFLGYGGSSTNCINPQNKTLTFIEHIETYNAYWPPSIGRMIIRCNDTKYKKAWRSYLLPVPRLEAFALPIVVKRATRNPRRWVYILSLHTITHTYCHIRGYTIYT